LIKGFITAQTAFCHCTFSIYHCTFCASLRIKKCPVAQCYAERGIAMTKLSVRLSVTLMYRDHTGWNSSKIISPLVSLVCSLFADPINIDPTPKGTPWNIDRNREWYRKSGFQRTNALISVKRGKIGPIGSHTRCRLVQKSTTSDDLWARFKVIDTVNAAKLTKCIRDVEESW